MRPEPPANLVNLLARLELAAPEQVAAVASRVDRAADLAEFDSVWLDALVEKRVLTPFQAAEIIAGRGESLRYGPYAVTRPLARSHFAECYAARHVESRRAVQLHVVRRPQVAAAPLISGLAKLVADRASLAAADVAAIEDFGTIGPLVWTACAAVDGVSAADWMIENGRFPALAVLHLAREIAAQLAECEQAGIVHGDLCAAGLILQHSGHIVFSAPGLRGVVRPHEGYSFGDLRPEAYDYLAPERIAEGTPPGTASDMYACGCLWWHLLTGRVPFAGGNSLEKLKAVHAARLTDVSELAPDVPDELSAVLGACLAREVSKRPLSFAQLSDALGVPTRAGCASLATVLGHGGVWQMVRRSVRGRRRSRHGTPWVSAIAVGIVLVFVALTPMWLLQSGPESAWATRAPAKPLPVAEQTALANPSVASKERPRLDSAVEPATANIPLAEERNLDLVLPADEMLRIEQLDLKPHVQVRGRGGKRPLVIVPRRGLLVACEDVTFTGIDFVWEDDRTERAAETPAQAMLVVRAQTATFARCTFAADCDLPPAAIAWTGAADELTGPGGELAVVDCVFRGPAAVVDCQGQGPLSLAVSNALCIDSGPIVRLQRAPRPDEPLALRLDHVTTRGRSTVLECRYGRLHENAGPITITASSSALAVAPNGGLVILTGSSRPEPLVRALTWTGEGSIVTPDTAMLLWRGTGRRAQVWPEEDLEIAGLVRSALEFAGAADGAPADSLVTRWQVPLRSDEPPGANPRTLAAPRAQPDDAPLSPRPAAAASGRSAITR